LIGGVKMNWNKKRIFVVDDDVDILRVFRKILEKEGFAVKTAETGKDALKKIKKAKFSAYLVDVKLPDMDGTELLLQIPNYPKIIKIIMTGFSANEAGKKAADYGADDFLVKPVKSEELITTVRENLSTVQEEG
jgi:DNA-binding NtrC family response regulator